MSNAMVSSRKEKMEKVRTKVTERDQKVEELLSGSRAKERVMRSSAMFVARGGTLLGTVGKTYAMLRQMVRVQSQHQSGAQGCTQSSPPQQSTQNRVARINEP